MKLFILTIITAILFQSCKKEVEIDFKENFNYVNEVFNADFDKNIDDQTNKFEFYINQNKLNSTNSEKISHYSNLTNDYLNFLNELNNEFKKNNKNPLIEADKHTEMGKKYILKTDDYRNQILKIVTDEGIKKSIALNFSTKNPIIDFPEHGKVMVDHLDYYFKGVNIKSFLLYIKNKKRIAFDLRNDYLMRLMLSN